MYRNDGHNKQRTNLKTASGDENQTLVRGTSKEVSQPMKRFVAGAVLLKNRHSQGRASRAIGPESANRVPATWYVEVDEI